MNPDATNTDAAPDLDAYLSNFGEHYASAMEDAGSASSQLPGRRRRRRRPRLRTGAAIGAFSLTAVVAAAVLLPGGGKLDVVEAANAALGARGDIVHYRLRSEIGFQETRPQSGRCAAGPGMEVWRATAGRTRYRVRVAGPPAGCSDGDMRTADGARITGAQEWAADGSTRTNYIPDLNRLDIVTGIPSPPSGTNAALPGIANGAADPIAEVRAALASGRLHAAGRSREGGRDLLVLKGRTTETTGNGKPPSGLITHHDLRYLVDAASYAPVRLSTSDTTYFFQGNGRPKDGKFTSSTTIIFELYEALPFNAENDRLLSIHPVRPAEITTRAAKVGR